MHDAILALLDANREALIGLDYQPCHVVLVTSDVLHVVLRSKAMRLASDVGKVAEFARVPADQVPVVIVAEVRERERGWQRVWLEVELATLERVRRIVR